MSFILFAWIATIVYGIEVFVGKIASKYSIKNPWMYNFFWSLLIVAITVPISLLNHVGLPKELPNLLSAAVFYALTNVLYILTMFLLDVSVLSPLFNIRTVFAVILAAFFVGEVLTSLQYILIGILFIAGIFLTMDERMSLKSFFRPSILLALITMLSVAFMGIFIKKSIALNGYWETTLWTQVIAQVCMLPTIVFFKKDVHKLTPKNVSVLFLISVLGTLGTLAANKATQTNVGITSAILSIPISMFLAMGASIFWPRLLEKHPAKIYLIRLAAAIIMVAAALRLSQ
ncbi:MAG: DMT family transporter [Patescibacteria group bacterium]|nr:DMT family transporter [Patescibacteria group bacterium]